MVVKCEHTSASSKCYYSTVPIELKSALQQHYNHLTDAEQDIYLLGCTRKYETNTKKSNYKGKKKLTTEYHLYPFQTTDAPLPPRICFYAFCDLYTTTQYAMEIITAALMGTPRGEDKRKYNKIHKNKHHPNTISQPRWKRLCDWIKGKGNVPREPGHYKGRQIEWIQDLGEPLCHNMLLARYNTWAAANKYEVEKIWTWKTVWYTLLNLKGKWKFKPRKENCCELCLNLKQNVREATDDEDKEEVWHVVWCICNIPL